MATLQNSSKYICIPHYYHNNTAMQDYQSVAPTSFIVQLVSITNTLYQI